MHRIMKPKLSKTGIKLLIWLFLLTGTMTQRLWAGGACTAARVHDWCKTCPLYAGAGAAPTTPGCTNCNGMPNWWVSEPYVSLCMMDTPLSYTMSWGQKLDFTFYYKQRARMPAPDEFPTYANCVQPDGYPGAANCGSDAYWGNNWNASVVLWDANWVGAWRAVNQGAYTYYYPPSLNVFNSLYEAYVFLPSGGIQYFKVSSASSAPDPQTQVALQSLSSHLLITSSPAPDPNNANLFWGDDNNNIGAKLVYPDGSQDVFGLIAYDGITTSQTLSYPSGQPSPIRSSVRAMLTKKIDAQGRVTQLAYESFQTPAGTLKYRLKYVVDPEDRTNIFYYTTAGSFLISEIDDPYGRKISLYYNSDGTLQSITDAAGLATSFQYPPQQVTATTSYSSSSSDVVLSTSYTTVPSSGWINKMTTPYGTSQFCYYEMDDSTVIDGVQQRAIYVSEPTGAQQLFYYLHKANGMVASSDTAPSVPGFANFDNGILGGVSGHNALSYRNTFHWGRRQFAALAANSAVSTGLANALAFQTPNPTSSANSFSSALAALGANDFGKAEMKHWLWQSDNVSLSGSLSSDRAPSFDTAGQNLGSRTWYNYLGKPNNGAEDLGSDPQIACVANLLSDGSTNYTTYNFFGANSAGAGLVSDTESTFSKPDGSLGVLTNWFKYAGNSIDLLSVSNSAGQYVNYGYNGFHEITAMTNALNQVTTLSWDFDGSFTNIQFPSGESIQLNRNYSDLTFDPTGSYFIPGPNYHFPSSIVFSPSGRTFNNNYQTGLLVSISDDRGVTVQNTWDGLNRLTSTVFPDNTYTSNRYDRLDLGGVRDRLGNWTTFAHDGLRHLTFTTNANNFVSSNTWCGCGSLQTITDASNNVTTFGYDNQGNLTSVACPDNTVWNYQYDSFGRVFLAYDAAGRAVQMSYNNQSLVTNYTGAFGSLESIIYDAVNRPVSVTDANGITIGNHYDLINRLTQRTWPDAISETYVYSTNGLIAYTNRDGFATFYARDGAGRLLAVTNANQAVTQFAYVSLNNITNLTDGNTNQTQWQYNEYGWLTNKINAAGSSVLAYQYNANGWPINRWTPEKGNAGYRYDGVGNLTNITYPNSSIIYQYDALNRLHSMVDGLGTTTFGYDPASHLQSESGPWLNVGVNYG